MVLVVPPCKVALVECLSRNETKAYTLLLLSTVGFFQLIHCIYCLAHKLILENIIKINISRLLTKSFVQNAFNKMKNNNDK